MANTVPEGEVPVTGLLIMAASMMPAYVYVVAVLILLVVILYGFLEFHFLGDFFRGFRGDRVKLTFDPSSMIYENVVSKCRVLQGRYLATLWLSSPHLQIAFLTLYGRPPVFTYRRQLFSVSDGGTIALDWLLASDVAGGSLDNVRIISEEDITPIVIVVPGLTSDSSSAKIGDEGSFRAPNGRRCNPSLKQTTEQHLLCHEASCTSYETRSCRNRLQNKNINITGTAQNEHESHRHRTSEGAAKKFHGFKGVIGIGLCTVLSFPSLLIREVQYFYGYIAKLILPTEGDIIMV